MMETGIAPDNLLHPVQNSECILSGLANREENLKILSTNKGRNKKAGGPADVGGSLALAGIDLEVAQALVDADNLPLVYLLPWAYEQLPSRLCQRRSVFEDYEINLWQGSKLSSMSFVCLKLFSTATKTQTD